MEINDSVKLYQVIWDAIRNIGDYSYAELIGVLEVIKAEVVEEYFQLEDEENAEN